MVDKPRKPGRPAGPKAGSERGARPGDRPRNGGGRHAGKPGRGPARPRMIGGIDERALERLEQEGLLNKEGRRLRQQPDGGPRKGQAPRGPRQGYRVERAPRQGDDAERSPRQGQTLRGPRPAAGPRSAAGPRPGAAPRTAAGPRQPRTAGFDAPAGGYSSVDEQLAQSMMRPRRPGVRRFAAQRDDREEAPRRLRANRPAAERPYQGDEQRPARVGRKAPVGRPVPAPQVRRKLDAAEVEVAERLHKVMARAGVASRRHSEELIQAGRVTVNGQVVTELGTKVIAGRDRIELDGRPLGKPESFVYILMNKPKGYVTTLYDPQGRPKVIDLLGGEIGERIYPVGRLDYDTEGLLLLTNDGDLANALLHPARQVQKTYIAKVRGVPGPVKLRALETGIELEDGITAPADVRMIEAKPPNAATLSIRIHEGRNRQVRRMCEAIGHEVIHLKRTTLGPLQVKDLPVGQWRPLEPKEVADLYQTAGLRQGGKPRPTKRGR